MGWEGNRYKSGVGLPLNAIRRPRDTSIWKLEAALKCRSCRKGRHAPPVHMIKLTATREITPYKWVHPDDERWSVGRWQLSLDLYQPECTELGSYFVCPHAASSKSLSGT